MKIYDQSAAERVRQKMHEFLVEAVRITRPKLDLLNAALAAQSEGHDKASALEFDGSQISSDALQASLDYPAYLGFWGMLQKIDVSADFVKEFTAEMSRVLQAIEDIDSGDVKGITEELPTDIQVVEIKTQVAQLEAERTAWLQYSSLCNLFAAKDRARAVEVQRQNPDVPVVGANTEVVQAFIRQNLTDLGSVRELRQGRDYNILTP